MKRLLLILPLLSGCATYSTYKCPDPIGEIVRQDCEDYRIRYESLKAKLSISIGPLKIGGGVEEKKLRDPSELVQVMMHQMLTLCHDYNACRVTNDEYSRRREEADRTFTGVMALLEQLKTPDLDSQARKDLLDELFALLRGTPPAPKVAKPKKPKEFKITDGAFRHPWSYWYKSKFTPPKPPPPAKGVPFIMNVRPYHERGKLKSINLSFWGDMEDDDRLVVAKDLECEVKAWQGKPKGSAKCRTQGKLEGTRFSARYIPGATGQPFDLGVLDLDPNLPTKKAWLAFQPDPVRVDPIKRERPWLIVHNVAKKQAFASARCWIGKKPVKSGKSGALKASHDNHRAMGSKLTRYAIPLPYVHNYPGSTSDDESFSKAAGNWRCKISFDGEPVLEIRFKVNSDGTLEPHPGQRGNPGNAASPWWLLETKDIRGRS
jgi:hypothetical protein